MGHIDQLDGTSFHCFQNVWAKAGGIISEKREKRLMRARTMMNYMQEQWWITCAYDKVC